MTELSKLRKARAYARKVFNELRAEERRELFWGNRHPSFAAKKALLVAAEKYDDILNPMVEGWCDELGKHGVSYLNSGDTYSLTLFYDTKKDRFSVSTLANFIG